MDSGAPAAALPEPFILATARLRLRPIATADLADLVDLHADPEVMRHIGPPTPLEYMRDEVLPRWAAMERDFPGCGFYAAIVTATGEFAGWFHLKPQGGTHAELDLGYRLQRACWNRGYATEGSQALVVYAFEKLGAQRLVARTLESNRASQHVLQKCGFRLESRYHEEHYPGGAPAFLYGLDARPGARRDAAGP